MGGTDTGPCRHGLPVPSQRYLGCSNLFSDSFGHVLCKARITGFLMYPISTLSQGCANIHPQPLWSGNLALAFFLDLLGLIFFLLDSSLGKGLELSSCGTVVLLWVRSQDTTKSSTAWTSSRAGHTGWRQGATITVLHSLRAPHSNSSLQLA
jgi:hypothetical protein